MSKKYNCPHCNTEIFWDESYPYRPFCSKRCKLIDFGEWANEHNRISSGLVENPEDFPDLESEIDKIS